MNRRPDQTTSAWHTFAATAGFFSGRRIPEPGRLARVMVGRTVPHRPRGADHTARIFVGRLAQPLRAANPHPGRPGRRSGRRDPHLTPAARAVQPAEAAPDPTPRLSVETGQRLSRYTTQAHDVYSVAGLSSAPCSPRAGARPQGWGYNRG